MEDDREYAMDDFVCSWCGREGDKMKVCTGCKRNRYCDALCQKSDWRCGHKGDCKERRDVPDVETPCGMCRFRAADDRSCGRESLCYRCGAAFCGSCRTLAEKGQVERCPGCRRPPRAPTDAKDLEALEALVAASPSPLAEATLGAWLVGGKGQPVAREKAFDPVADARAKVAARAEGVESAAARAAEALADASAEDADDAAIAEVDAAADEDRRRRGVALLRSADGGGCAAATLSLGVCYANGFGVVACPAQAIAHYEAAADAGLADALYNLGCYALDRGDDAEAAAVFSRAADRGDGDAALVLGEMREAGRGVPVDCAAAAALYGRCAGAEAATRLAALHRDGRGVPASGLAALKLLKGPAQDARLREAQAELGDLFLVGAPDVAPDEERAERLLGAAASKGHDRAAYQLGCLLVRGGGDVEGDEPRAAEHFRKAARAGVPAALYNLGAMYARGFLRKVEVPEPAPGAKERPKPVFHRAEADKLRASRLWRQAADRGFGPAAYEVARFFERGHQGHAEDPAAAVSYYKLAAKGGHGEACRRLSLLYFKGVGVAKDEKKAAAYFARAKARGPPPPPGPAPFAPAAACPRLARPLDAAPRGLRL